MIPLTIGQCATLACLLEATTPKPGNVHRGADFEDLTFFDFAVSAAMIGPSFEVAAATGVGRAVFDAISATRQAVATNTNLGTVLLLAPLAAVPRDRTLADGIGDVLRRLTADDSRLVYTAIRLAQPGGLGKAEAMDVAGDPPDDLLAAMAAAADRDLVARQYVENFFQVLQFVAPAIAAGQQRGWLLSEAIIHTQVSLLERFPDSLIARKCGPETAQKAAAMSRKTLQAGEPGDPDYHVALDDLDFWLRSDGHRRNPGTTADLIAAGLFAALRDGLIEPPFR